MSFSNIINTISSYTDINGILADIIININAMAPGEGPTSWPRNYFDVSSVLNYQADVVSLCVLELTNSSGEATVKYRNCSAGTWYGALETSITLKAAFTGSTTKIVIMSDPHIGIGSGNPDASLTTAIDDIDDNITGVSKIFVLGDIANDNVSYYADYKVLRADSDIADTDWHELAGNHDILDGENGFRDELLGSESADPYYSIAVGNCVFILLSDDDTYAISSDANTWLQSELSDNSDNNCFILTHEGQLHTTRQTDETDGYIGNIDAIVGPLDIVSWFCGHSHGYPGVSVPDSTCIFVETMQLDLDTNCTTFYPIGEGEGATTSPVIGSTDGSLGGSCSWGDDAGEDYIDIPNGGSDSVDIAHNSDLLFGTGGFSIALRIYLPSVEASETKELLEKQGGSAYFQSLMNQSRMTFEGGRISEGRFGDTHNSAPEATTKMDILLVREPNIGTQIFVDGVRLRADTQTYNDFDANPDDAGATLRIGRGTGGSIAMRLYYLGFWDVALNRLDAKNITEDPYSIGT